MKKSTSHLSTSNQNLNKTKNDFIKAHTINEAKLKQNKNYAKISVDRNLPITNCTTKDLITIANGNENRNSSSCNNVCEYLVNNPKSLNEQIECIPPLSPLPAQLKQQHKHKSPKQHKQSKYQSPQYIQQQQIQNQKTYTSKAYNNQSQYKTDYHYTRHHHSHSPATNIETISPSPSPPLRPHSLENTKQRHS